MLRPLLVGALLLTTLFAGCSDPSGDGNAEEEPAAFDGVQVSDTTGAIRGVVVSEAIIPIAGVLVKLVDGRNATTDAEGAFVFNGLEPGDYFVTASKFGYLTQQQSATVVAGEASPPITKILLPVDPGAATPTYQEFVFDGYIQCSGTFVVVGFAACNMLADSGAIDDRFDTHHPLTGKPTWIQSEMVWDSTQAAGNEMSVMYSWGCDTNGGFPCDHGTSGESPLLLTADADAIEDINGGNYTGGDLWVRVFNTGLSETGGSLGVTYAQQYTVYTHVFYGYAPPEGWRISEDPVVPQPPK
jgi:hypothetical protein